MFSKSRSITRNIKTEDGYIVGSQYYNMPDKRILFLSQAENRKSTTLKIFSMDDINNPIEQRTLEGQYHVLCLFPNGTILLGSGLGNRHLLKICPLTLNTLSTQKCEFSFYSAGVIDNDSFFIIKKNGNYNDRSLEHSLIIYNWKENVFKESSKILLSAHPKTEGSDMHHIQHITKNRYCCHIRGDSTDEFRILIFEINIKTNQVNELGIIKPKAQVSGAGSAASGEIVVLSNGQLLTYHHCHDNLQIWDTGTLECVKEWNWADIEKPADFSVWCLNIWKFPDSMHLLVYQGEKIYLFNTDKLQLKQIELPNKFKPECYGEHHVLANGQVLAFVCKDNIDSNHLKVFHFDLKEMVHFREKMTDYKVSKHISQLFLNSILPAELMDIIISDAFTPEVEESVARRAYDDFDREGENKNCIMM